MIPSPDSADRPHPEGPLRLAIVANYTANTPESNNRFNELAHRFATRGVEVELITSDFSHTLKAPRALEQWDTTYRITHLHEPGYRRNVSIARLRSQAAFAREVGRYLRGLELAPHIVLAATPPPRAALEAGRVARERHAAFALDVQDLWPEAFSMVTRHGWIVDLAFRGMRRAAAAAYRSADLVIGVSRTYTRSAEEHGADRARTRVVFLGTDLAGFDELARRGTPAVELPTGPDALPAIGYAGGLSASYDLPLVIDALVELAAHPTAPLRPTLVIMGDGALRERFSVQAEATGLDIRFTGNLPYPQMVPTLQACGIAVNPIVAGSAGSILNKAGDYAAAGLPVVSSQESPEYHQLLEDRGAGLSCAPGDVHGMAAGLRALLEDPGLRARMAAGSRAIAEELFDRSVTYEAMVDEVLGLVAAESVAR